MFVSDNLPCLSSGSGKTHTEHYAVQSALKHNHKVFTRHAFHPVGLLVIISERFLKNSVNKFRFLLFSQLKSVLAYLLARSCIGSVGLLVITKISGFQAERPASFQYGNSVNCHFNFPPVIVYSADAPSSNQININQITFCN